MSWSQSYAERIAHGFRHDAWPNRLQPLEARLAASVYGVEAPHEATTIKELSLLIAQKLLGET